LDAAVVCKGGYNSVGYPPSVFDNRFRAVGIVFGFKVVEDNESRPGIAVVGAADFLAGALSGYLDFIGQDDLGFRPFLGELLAEVKAPLLGIQGIDYFRLGEHAFDVVQKVDGLTFGF